MIFYRNSLFTYTVYTLLHSDKEVDRVTLPKYLTIIMKLIPVHTANLNLNNNYSFLHYIYLCSFIVHASRRMELEV